MHERNLLPWNMFTQIFSKWRRIFCERLINISWKNHLQQLAAGNCLGAIIWGVIMRGVIILGTIILVPIAWEPYFFRGSCLAGNYSWGQSPGGQFYWRKLVLWQLSGEVGAILSGAVIRWAIVMGTIVLEPCAKLQKSGSFIGSHSHPKNQC